MSNSSPGTPTRTSPRAPVTQRQTTGGPPIADVYACDWTGQFSNRVDFLSEAADSTQHVASTTREAQQEYLAYAAQGEELQR
eukprot:5810723-Amphidinium_carterae.1